jgi:EmrB/QacA subfamily drug resistance transporter
LSVLIPVLDNTILYVAFPKILADFDTELTSLQWVITGYSLTFATLLIIGGRLGDMFGHRRTFIVGAAIFGGGSLIAALSQSVPQLFIGEAVIEGIGASLMIPATLAILSTTFAGRERAVAFSWWGATAGAAVVFGPLVGGFLTTNYSWRWAFGINVIIVPIIVTGALMFMHPDTGSPARPRLDIPGALLVASGSFTLIFGLSEGTTYGWWKPIKDPSIGAVSIIPFAFALSAVLLATFVAVERAKERRQQDPLFEFGQLRHRGFRYGLLTTMVLAMGQFAVLFVVPLLLQAGQHLSALRVGEWMVPQGLCIAIAAPIGGRLTRRFSITSLVRSGLVLQVVGLLLVASAAGTEVTFWSLQPGLVLFGLGVGLASSQLTNVVLSDVDPDKIGVASGTNTTVRQIGLALGIAVFATFLNALTIRHAIAAVRASDLDPATKVASVSTLHTKGVNFSPPASATQEQLAKLGHIVESAVAAGARPALLFAAAVVAIGTLLSFLIPRVTVVQDVEPAALAAEVA